MRRWWLPATSLMAGLTVAGWIWWAVGRVQPTEEQAPAALLIRETPPPRGGFEWWEIEEQRLPDGTWVEVGRTRKRQRPDGVIEEVK